MRKRINQDYGNIHPKNCYVDGQATNCRLNAQITPLHGSISLWMCLMDDDEEIIAAERRFIRAYQPPWNLQQ